MELVMMGQSNVLLCVLFSVLPELYIYGLPSYDAASVMDVGDT